MKNSHWTSKNFKGGTQQPKYSVCCYGDLSKFSVRQFSMVSLCDP